MTGLPPKMDLDALPEDSEAVGVERMIVVLC
jgi:hypothetical protein